MRANTSLSTRIFKNGYCFVILSILWKCHNKNGNIHFILFHSPFWMHDTRYTTVECWMSIIFIYTFCYLLYNWRMEWNIHMTLTHEISKLQIAYSIVTISFFSLLLLSVQNNQTMERLGFWIKYTAHLFCLHTKEITTNINPKRISKPNNAIFIRNFRENFQENLFF